jgi:segregation and condensation protein B
VSDNKGKSTMSPPRLKLVTPGDDYALDSATDNLAAAEALELAAALADAQVGFPPEVEELKDRNQREKLRIIEALLFASKEPLDVAVLQAGVGPDGDVPALLADLEQLYSKRGVNLVRVAGKWAFRTSDDLSYLLEKHAVEERRLSRAALETLAIIAYHQPVTRAEIEDIRGVSTSGGTLDLLMESGWIRPRGRRRAPGKPITYGTTESFLSHFGLDTVRDLPGLQDLKAAGLLDSTLPPGFTVPEPSDIAALMPDELPLEDEPEVEDQTEFALDEPIGDDDDENDIAADGSQNSGGGRSDQNQ